MDDVAQAARTIGTFLQTFTSRGALRLRFRVKLRGAKPGVVESAEDSESSQSDPAAGNLYVEFSGPDTPILTARNGEVLNALEHIAAKILRLEPEEHDRVSFDADHFKSNRDRQLRESAAAAIERVQTTGRPHSFPAMTSRERRMLHLILAEAGVATASSGEGPGRFVVAYPAGSDPSGPAVVEQPVRRHDASRIRDAFRHR